MVDESEYYDDLLRYRGGGLRTYRPTSPFDDLDIVSQPDVDTATIQKRQAADASSPWRSLAKGLRTIARKIPYFDDGDSEHGQTPGLLGAAAGDKIQGQVPQAPTTALGWLESGGKHLANTGMGMAGALLDSAADWSEGFGSGDPNWRPQASSMILPPNTLPQMILGARPFRAAIARGEASPTSSFDSLRSKLDRSTNAGWGDVAPDAVRGGADPGIVGEERYVSHGVEPRPQDANQFKGWSPLRKSRENITDVGALGQEGNVDYIGPADKKPGQISKPDIEKAAVNQDGFTRRDRIRLRTEDGEQLFAKAGDEGVAALVGKAIKPFEENLGHPDTQTVRDMLGARGVPYKQRLGTGSGGAELGTDYVKPNRKATNGAEVDFRIPSELNDHPGNSRMMIGREGKWVREPIIDLAEQPPGRRLDSTNTTNLRGDPYAPSSGSNALSQAMDWLTTNRLVGDPLAVPRFARYAEEAPKPKPAEGADMHPDQLKLLAKGGDKEGAALTGAGKSKVAAPAISKGQMFDYDPKRLEREVTQTDVKQDPHIDTEPRWLSPSTRKGMTEYEGMSVPEHIADQRPLGKPAMKRLLQWFDIGAKERGGLGWYATKQLRDKYRGELGKAKGDARFDNLMDHMGAGSPLSNVETNIPRAAWTQANELRGKPVPKPGDPIAPGLGSIAQKNHQRLAARVHSGEGIDPTQNPKPFRFAENNKGNSKAFTGDSHATRAADLKTPQGMPLQGDPDNAYHLIGQKFRKGAAARDVDVGPFQSGTWVGAAEKTGVDASSMDPLLKIFEGRVRGTADKRGLKPEEVLRRMMRGEEDIPLLAKGGSKEAALMNALKKATGGDRDLALRRGKEGFYQNDPFDASEYASLKTMAEQPDRQRMMDYFKAKREFASMDKPLTDDARPQSKAERAIEGRKDLYQLGPELEDNGIFQRYQGPDDARYSDKNANLDHIKRRTDYAKASTEFRLPTVDPEDITFHADGGGKVNALVGQAVDRRTAGPGRENRKTYARLKPSEQWWREGEGQRDMILSDAIDRAEKNAGNRRPTFQEVHEEMLKDPALKEIDGEPPTQWMVRNRMAKYYDTHLPKKGGEPGKGRTAVTSDPDFRAKFDAAMEKHGGNQKKVAEELGISQPTVNRYANTKEGQPLRYGKKGPKLYSGGDRLKDQAFLTNFLQAMDEHGSDRGGIAKVADKLGINTGAVSKYRDKLKWKPGMTAEQATEYMSQQRGVLREMGDRPGGIRKSLWDLKGKEAARGADYEAARRAAEKHAGDQPKPTDHGVSQADLDAVKRLFKLDAKTGSGKGVSSLVGRAIKPFDEKGNAPATPKDVFERAPRTTYGVDFSAIDRMREAYKGGASDQQLWEMAHAGPSGKMSKRMGIQDRDPEHAINWAGQRRKILPPHGWANLMREVKELRGRDVMEGEVGREVYPKGWDGGLIKE